MSGTSTDSPGAPARRRTTRGERLFVLGPLALAALVTAAALGTGAGAAYIGPLWLAAVAWTVPASLTMALRRGLRHRDWSAFGRHELPDDPHDAADFQSRTGTYQWLGDHEDRLSDDGHLHDHR